MSRFIEEVFPFFMGTYLELANKPGTDAAKRYWSYVQTVGMFQDIKEEDIEEEFTNLGWLVDKSRGLMFRRRKEKHEQVTGYNPRGIAKRRTGAAKSEGVLRGRGDLGS